ncbi:MAG: hypothetical protein PVH48_05775 [Cyclobacteriaceae bacterium]|jgi:hypothetical protein
MKRLLISGSAGLIILFALMFNVATVSAKDNVVGTWDYSAPNAPYEYSKGQIIITEGEDKLEGKVDIDGYEMKLNSVKVEDGVLSFSLYVEGEYVSVKLTVNGDSLEGKASTSEGLLEVTGKRAK